MGRLTLSSLAAVVAASSVAIASENDGHAAVLVEMFLSQSCKASPPAAALAEELASRDDVVALIWHLDYWNALAANTAGPWRDPYSKADFGARHIAYNARIRGRERGFSPQAVINGSYSAVGFHKQAIQDAIVSARGLETSTVLDIAESDGQLTVSLSSGPAEAYLISFHPAVVTRIDGGDNAGLTFSEPNVVAGVIKLGEAPRDGAKFNAPQPEEGLGCAVIVHEPGLGKVIAARYCPQSATRRR